MGACVWPGSRTLLRAGRLPPAPPLPWGQGRSDRPRVSCRLESGSSNPTAGDCYGDRASARARREAREARLATLTGRGEEGGGRDYKKVGSCVLSLCIGHSLPGGAVSPVLVKRALGRSNRVTAAPRSPGRSAC